VALPVAVAQEAGSGDQQPAPAEHGPARAYMDNHAAILAKRLKLNSDQQSKVEAILKSEQSQRESLQSDSTLSKEDRHSKMMDIHKSSNEQIRGLLDPDQQKKWDEMQSRHEERMQEHHHEQAPGRPPTSPQ
jgi:periplasmic protein CpxP/Spy